MRTERRSAQPTVRAAACVLADESWRAQQALACTLLVAITLATAMVVSP